MPVIGYLLSLSEEILKLLFGTIPFFLAIYLLLIIWLHRGLKHLKYGHNSTQPQVSIIVAARNEEKLLPACLSALAKQTYDYHRLQFVLIDDRSEDQTAQIMTEFCAKHENAIQVSISTNQSVASPKKRALAQGIHRATGEILLFTDADCQPSSQWVAQMIRHFEPGVEMVVGFSPLISEVKNYWSGIIELDSLSTALVAAAGLGNNRGITCNGRNLAYTKAVFQAVAGFREIEHSLSGDDDLFLHLIQQKTDGRVRFCRSPESTVPAQAVLGFQAFIRQRRRHFSTGANYPLKVKLGYFLFHLSNLMIFAGFCLGLFRADFLFLCLSALLIKFLFDFILLYHFGKIMKYRQALKYFLGWELYFILLNTILGPASLLGSIRWK